jgi:hypothetical protein
LESHLTPGVSKINKSALPVIYRANSKAWMRADIFVEWIKHLDYYFRTMDYFLLIMLGHTLIQKFLMMMLAKWNLTVGKNLAKRIIRKKQKKSKKTPDITLTKSNLFIFHQILLHISNLWMLV